MPNQERPLSSRELLSRIGLSEDATDHDFDAAELDDLDGDLSAVLRERFALLTRPHRFSPGDLVTWKPGLRNRRIPRYGEPAVVVSVLESPVTDSDQESGSTYFREPLDLVLGVIWDGERGRGDFVTFHFDGRRFEAWEA
jgi:hypothetical protein